MTSALSRSAKRLMSCRNMSVNLSRGQAVWTPDSIVTSPYKDVEIPNRTVVEHVFENLERWSDKIATICGLTNRSYTYHQLYKYSRNFASQLRTKLGVRCGDVICTMLPNSPEYVLAVVGILSAGAELTTINPAYTPHEVQRQLILSKPKIIIGNTDTVDVIKESLKLAKMNIPIICIENNGRFVPDTILFQELTTDADHSVINDVKKTADDVAILPYSSGTTGLPKGVELTNKNIVVNFLQSDVEGVKQYRDTTASHQESIMAVLPFYHIYGLSIIALHKLSVGAKIVTLPKFQPDTFLSTLKNHKISLLYVVPPIVLFLGSHPESKKEHLAYVDRAFSGAAPLPKLDVERLLNKCKADNTYFINKKGKYCSYCGRYTIRVSTTCPHCRANWSRRLGRCRNCEAAIDPEWSYCEICGVETARAQRLKRAKMLSHRAKLQKVAHTQLPPPPQHCPKSPDLFGPDPDMDEVESFESTLSSDQQSRTTPPTNSTNVSDDTENDVVADIREN